MEPLDGSLLAQSLNFHGNQLQKLWEAEHGDSSLVKQDVKDLSFNVYGQRQKYLTFQDRGKRLKLHQFIAKKADFLFSKDATVHNPSKEETVVTEDMYAIMPPFETYLNVDKQRRLKYFFEVSLKHNVAFSRIIIHALFSESEDWGFNLGHHCQ